MCVVTSRAAAAPRRFSATAMSIWLLRTRTSANSAMTKNAFISKKNTTSNRHIAVCIPINHPFRAKTLFRIIEVREIT